nr:bifunctional diguanylate cyclase/phosphodiesterase [Motilibacter deserti]
MAAGVARQRPRPVAAWAALVVALACFVLGDALWTYYERVLREDPFPSAADGAYLGGYVPLLGGVLLLLRARRAGREASAGIESGIVALALVLAAWEPLLEPALTEGEGGLLARGILTAYPVADLLVASVLVRLLLEGESRNGGLRLLGLALLCAVVSDTAFLVGQAYGTYDAGQLSDTGYLLEYVLLAAAAWHPAAVSAPASSARRSLLGRHRLLLVGGCALVGPVLLFALEAPDVRDVRVVAASSLLITLLVLWRASRLVRAVRESAALIAHRAAHDQLTGLLNRDRFNTLVDEAVAQPGEAAVVRMDLDGFRSVNDTEGHEAGDQLLRQTAGRVRACAPSGTWARLEGDEFAALLTGPGAAAAAEVLAEDLVRRLREPFDVGGRPALLRASAGFASTCDGRGNADTLLAAADVALSVAKSHGGGRAVAHRPDLDTAVLTSPALAARLEQALDAGELEVFYQPVVELASGAVTGTEALVRWRRDGALVPPDEFLPVAHSTGLVVQVDRFVLQRAVGQLTAWDAEGLGTEGHYVGVNFSVRSLERRGLVEEVLAVLGAAGLSPARLLVEVTEEAAASSAAVRATLERLRAHGMRVALDDFGTGYSSLAYLEQIPADVLKVAKPLVDPLDAEPATDHVLRALVALAADCGLEVLAEGVETERQRRRLLGLGVSRAQGYLFSRPLPAEEARGRLTAYPELVAP